MELRAFWVLLRNLFKIALRSGKEIMLDSSVPDYQISNPSLESGLTQLVSAATKQGLSLYDMEQNLLQKFYAEINRQGVEDL